MNGSTNGILNNTQRHLYFHWSSDSKILDAVHCISKGKTTTQHRKKKES